MSKYFDKDEVEVVRTWIISGAPIPFTLPNLNIPNNITSTNISLNESAQTTIQNNSTCPTTTADTAPILIPENTDNDTTPPTLIQNNQEHKITKPLQQISTSLDFECPVLVKEKPAFDSIFFRLMNVEAHPEAFAEAKQFLSSRCSSDDLSFRNGMRMTNSLLVYFF
jgi:hypothetical protein